MMSVEMALSLVALAVAVVYLVATVVRRRRLLKSDAMHHMWGGPKASRDTRELEASLLEDEKEDYETQYYLVKSRTPLAARQAVYLTLLILHGMAAAWHSQRGSKRWAGDAMLCGTWIVVYIAEGIDHAYVKLRAEPKRVSLMIALVAVVAFVAVCFELQLSKTTAAQRFFFIPRTSGTGLGVDLTPAALWLDLVVFCSATFWRKLALSASRSVSPPTQEEVALQLHDIVSLMWLTPTLLLAKTKVLEVKDLPPTNGEETTVELWKRFERIYPECRGGKSTTTTGKEKKQRRIWIQLVKLVAPQVSAFGVFAIMSVGTEYIRVFAFNQFLQLLQDHSRNATAYWMTVGALFVCPILTAALHALTSTLQTKMALRCRAVLIRLIYRKALRIDLGATGASVGEVVNLMSADVDSIVWIIAYSDQLWVPLLQASACLAFIFYLVGVAGVCAFVIMAAMAIVNNQAFKRIFATQRSLMVKRDERLSAISEALNNIRLIKLAAMERDIHAMISKLRDQELALVLRYLLGVAALFSFISSGPKLAALSTFLTYTLALGRRLSPAVGFTTLELLTNLEDSFISLPSAVDCLARAGTALQKLDEFLDVKEVQGLNFDLRASTGASAHGSFRWSAKSAKKDDDDDDDAKTKGTVDTKGTIIKRETGCFFCGPSNLADRPPPPAPPVSLTTTTTTEGIEETKDDITNPLLSNADASEEASLSSSSEDQAATLKDIALDLPKGALVLVVGATGAGKSSLVAALTNEIAAVQEDDGSSPSTLSGTSAALVPQKAWCQHATFRQNVAAFGADVDMKRYRRVIRACALETDLKLLTNGDKTKIGSRGINLSGGQQARINLARCVYARPDVAFLDDPLSAVDAHVAHHLYERAILGELRHATRILVTHQVDLAISRADYIVFVDKGCIVEHGSRSDLEQQGSTRLAAALSSSIAAAKKDDEQYKEDDAATTKNDPDDETRPIVGVDDVSGEDDVKENGANEDEYRDKGAVKWAAYAEYLNAVGSKVLLFFILGVIIMTQVTNFLQSLAMTSWISDMERGHRPNSFRCVLYMLASAAFVATFSGGFGIRSMTQVKASRRLHSMVLTKVLGSKVSFFDVTPVGRIQNRFSSDFQAIDRELPPALYWFVQDVMSPMQTIVAMVLTAPILLAAMPAILLYDVTVARTYIKGARDMKRLSSLNKSPIYDHFSESLNGLAVIRTFQAEAFSEAQISALIDTSIRCDRNQKLCFWWLAVRMEAFGSLLGGVTALLLATILFSRVDPALSGFVLQYASSMCFMVKYVIDGMSNLEISMNSMERVHEYINLEQEPTYHHGGNSSFADLQIVVPDDPPASWPEKGEIVADHLYVRYPKTPKPVLNDLSFRFPARTKTGIVGRTGAGKSTLSLAILRIVPTEAGSILIDGYDINKVKLERLRDAISVVPQDPAIFRGTVRSNLDARGIHDLPKLKNALARVQLAHMDLDREIEDAGSNLAVGERQLLCLARALLRDRSILCLDEATANVDVASDHKIQHVIRNELGEKAVICIAHRLKTIIFYDNVAVLDRGKLIEFGSPTDLINDSSTTFFGMCEASGDLSGLQDEAVNAANEKKQKLLLSYSSSSSSS